MRKRAQQEDGFSLIEVLVAFGVMMIAFLGALQISSYLGNESIEIEHRDRANRIANLRLEKLKAHSCGLGVDSPVGQSTEDPSLGFLSLANLAARCYEGLGITPVGDTKINGVGGVPGGPDDIGDAYFVKDDGGYEFLVEVRYRWDRAVDDPNPLGACESKINHDNDGRDSQATTLLRIVTVYWEPTSTLTGMDYSQLNTFLGSNPDSVTAISRDVLPADQIGFSSSTRFGVMLDDVPPNPANPLDGAENIVITDNTTGINYNLRRQYDPDGCAWFPYIRNDGTGVNLMAFPGLPLASAARDSQQQFLCGSGTCS